VLWALELAAFMEGLCAVHLPPLPPCSSSRSPGAASCGSSENDDIDCDMGSNDKDKDGDSEKEKEEAAGRAKRHEVRALKLLEKYKKAKYAFFENGRREALVNTRLQVLSEIMQDVYLLLDWPLAREQADARIPLSEGRSGVGLIAQSLRDICYTLLQLTNDQQVRIQAAACSALRYAVWVCRVPLCDEM
jgi:hypothetical protein